jgi:hemerythrin-like domain-containing protein
MSDNNALGTLESEHRLIEQVLTALDNYCDALTDAKEVDREDLARFVEFVREFVDGEHHRKEEQVLFPAMVESGLARDGEPGPISVMMHEHKGGRAMVAELSAVAERSVWPDDAIATVSRAGHGLSELMHAHIHKENNVLYPMARGLLSPELFVQLDERCAELDAAATESGKASRLEALGRTLIERYG